ncbi:MAG: hypothetical protein NFW04_14335 [Candidatus Accumulibacter sp.]|uniref:hypothetical protein n=1 Tax=Accumulibacter sp. TaxID=2053492 RepID=UPI0025D9D44C|nr:hypothetical protein [Accumulibacter sp.]MCM8599810.1 hypothetical protein [Accumulibacter sp.]
MATVSGQVASFAALKATIEATLAARGWTLADGILSRGTAFVQLTASAEALVLAAGTGQAGAALTGACPQTVKLLSFANASIQWPVVYVLHVFDAPDEVYCVLRYNVDRHQHLNWGRSSMPQIDGTGLWCSGSFRGDVDGSGANVRVFIDTGTGSQLGTTPYDGPGLGYFFAGLAGTYSSSFIHCGLEGAPAWRTTYGGAPGDLLGVSHKAGLLHALPSQFNQATVLLPIDVLLARQAQGQTIVATLAHARWCRLDFLDLSQPLVYGTERWIPYPLHAVHPVQRNGAGWPVGAQHSGTFGVALREPS